MKLKTLKDFEHQEGSLFIKDRHISEKELKAEAVKWAKHFNKLFEENPNHVHEGITWVLLEFFNLTEEDLK